MRKDELRKRPIMPKGKVQGGGCHLRPREGTVGEGEDPEAGEGPRSHRRVGRYMQSVVAEGTENERETRQ